MVRIPCVCPPKADGQTRHPSGDTITLRERLDFHAATAVRKNVGLLYEDDPDATTGEALATLTEGYILFGVESWSLQDARGKAVPVSRATVREFIEAHPDEAMVVGEAADSQYMGRVVGPLLTRGSNSSPDMPTDGSTSLTTGSISTPPKRSSRSSTTTIPTDDIETTSPPLVGASN